MEVHKMLLSKTQSERLVSGTPGSFWKHTYVQISILCKKLSEVTEAFKLLEAALQTYI